MFRLFAVYFRPHLGWFLAGTLFAVLTSAFATGYAYILGVLGNRLQDSFGAEATGETTWIWWVSAAIIGLALGRSVTLYMMTVANNTGVQRGLVDIQDAQYQALVQGDYARLAGDASGGFVSRFINDVNSIRDAGLRFANNFTKSVVTVIGMLGIMLWTDWQLTILLLVVYPIAFGPVIGLGNRIRKRSRQAQKQIGDVTAHLSEGFQSARVVKAYGLEEYQTERARKGFIERSRLFLKVLTDRAAVDPILEVTGGVALAGILGFAAWRIAHDAASLGDLLRIIGALAIASPELRALGTLNAVAQEGGAAADRVFEIVDAEPQLALPSPAVELGRAEGAVVFDDVRFDYPDGSAALSGLTFSAAPGETVALVGPSGAGKSTVFNLLLRLYDATGGAVRLDGRDVREFSPTSLRANLALVAQDAALFDDTVRANIALGRFDASEDEIEAAACAANAHDFIMALPQGYDTPVGEMGRNLSGGQRQRVALARAILRDAPVLLLDEATSALDAESEARVQTALADFSKGRTTLVIAHRLSTVRQADRIIVMEGGRVVEEGVHEALMASGGVYARLAELQLS
ncbi:MAG: ABC transporter ATP-binding protein/permease [Hyphomonadaceae bacterium]|nr:ABC transporter ATP-binding protein/permease [Hyphomonadaceae bacterium]